jgi:hypothetical protein
MNILSYILLSDCWFLDEECALWRSLLSRDLTDSVSVPGKCLITAEIFDTQTTWGGGSLEVLYGWKCQIFAWNVSVQVYNT